MTIMPDRVIAAVDVGKLSNVGWWRIADGGSGGGRDLDDLADILTADLNRGRTVALGIEAPIFIPAPTTTAGLGRQRTGEAGRPWCAGAGPIALAFGIQQTNYLLTHIAERLTTPIRAGVDVAALHADRLDLLVWEAFVSAGSKDRSVNDPHVWDARAAAEEFERRAATGVVVSDIAEPSVLNLAAAALIATGLSHDPGLLSVPCVVVRAPILSV